MKKTLIQHKEVGAGGAASIEFTSIPQTYTDLYVVVSSRSNRTAGETDDLLIKLNGVTTNLSSRALYGTGATAATGTSTNRLGWLPANAEATANTFGNAHFYIPNYTSSNAKSLSIDTVAENNATDALAGITSMLWNPSPQAAINAIEIYPLNGTLLMQYSSASLYGVSKYNTSAAPKASGGIISYDSANDKWVHVFTASGTFTPSENLTAEYLVIAGGGGGGYNVGGGGGAGGYRSSVSGESSGGGASAESALSLTASTGYTVTVGAGGTGSTSSTVIGGLGSNSVFSSITSNGGGGGGSAGSSVKEGASGGSGGGDNYGGTGGVGGSGTANQGYSGGGAAAGSSNYEGGGGGGAGSNGVSGVYLKAGDGGDGVTSSITGAAIARAGGGGGGHSSDSSQATTTTIGFGQAGGGNGGSNNFTTPVISVTEALPNTGSGGGGGKWEGVGGNGSNGGSGIVIVRYSA